MHPCTWVAPACTATSELATAQPASLWQWMPSWALGARTHVGHGLPDVVGQRAAVGVAEHERLGAGLLGRGQDGQREVRVAPVAVEEVLGVEEDAQVVRAQVAHRVGHHGHGLVERRAQRLGDVAVPRLGHDAGDRRSGLDQIGQDGVVLRLHAGPPGRAEGDQRGRGRASAPAGPGRRTRRPWGWRRAIRPR